MKNLKEVNEELKFMFQQHSHTEFRIPSGGITEVLDKNTQLNPPVKTDNSLEGRSVKRILVPIPYMSDLANNYDEAYKFLSQVVENFKKETGCTQCYFLKQDGNYIRLSGEFHAYVIEIAGVK